MNKEEPVEAEVEIKEEDVKPSAVDNQDLNIDDI